MPLRAPDPGTFEHLLEEVRIPADTLVRLSKYPKTEPWWSYDAYRFDGPAKGTPGAFGACYASQRLDVAFAESVIHEDSWFNNGQFEVPMAALSSRYVVPLQRPAQPELILADLTGEALKRLGLNNDISAGGDYTMTKKWAKAVHDADPKWDGVWYISRQLNEGFAVALFERSAVKKGRTRKLRGRPLDDLCDQFGVVGV